MFIDVIKLPFLFQYHMVMNLLIFYTYFCYYKFNCEFTCHNLPAFFFKTFSAIGKIGEVNNKIKECLLWALRYEAKAGVRAEACHSLIALNIGDDDVISILQERLLVESDHIVREYEPQFLSFFVFFLFCVIGF